MDVSRGNPPPTTAPTRRAAAVAPAAGPALAGDVYVPARRMAEQPQSKFGVRLAREMRPYAEALDRFVADSEAKIDLLADRLRQDPEFQRFSAPGAWQKASARERAAFADHVGKLQGEIFRYKPAKTHLTNEPDRNTDGGFDDKTGRLDLNRNADAFNDLGEFLNTVVHEQFHAYQHQLAHHRFEKADLRYAPSIVYRHNERWNFDAPEDAKKQPAEYAAYRRQPSEAHAFMMGERLWERLFG